MLKLIEANFNDFKNIHYFIELNLFHQCYLLNLNLLVFFMPFLDHEAAIMPLHLKNFFLYVEIKLPLDLMDLNFFSLLLDLDYYFNF
jgi:hypothetical protein